MPKKTNNQYLVCQKKLIGMPKKTNNQYFGMPKKLLISIWYAKRN